ncbi:E3 ubiquitin-protein ligase XIAP-like [Bombus fervidus]|uniref:E3 ubiquitin-protein ligase XIAP-like n=1 Tax=Bombus fervidus TaxID=203811 RepID=UPI003AB2ACE4
MYCPECPLVRHEHRGNVPIKSRSYLRPRRVSKLANLKYLTYESRLNTFVAWPNTYIRSEKLADAGFYYNGINDMVICHHCGIAIDNWSRGEDPCNRHATSSPGCCYIIKGRSCECINNVTGQDLHETFVEAPIETTDENHEGSDTALEKENQELENARSCKVCTEREATITFLPCGHLATCRYCSATFMKCIICQGKITAAVRIAFA